MLSKSLRKPIPSYPIKTGLDGTMGIADLVAGALELEVGAIYSDLLCVAGDLTIGADFSILLSLDSTISDYDYSFELENFFDVSGRITVESGFSLADNLLIEGLTSGASLTVSFMGDSIVLGNSGNASPVPEPSTALLFGVTLPAFLFARSRRIRSNA